MTSADDDLRFGNLLDRLPAKLADEALEVLAEAPNLRIERIVSRGHASPDGVWYDQPQAEFVVLISGAAHLEFADSGEIRELKAGDYLAIPARCRHRVAWTTSDEATVWLAVHYGSCREPAAQTRGRGARTAAMAIPKIRAEIGPALGL